MYTISPSAFEPIIEGTTNAKYPEGCLRFLSVKHLVRASNWGRVELHPIYSAIGTIAEEYVKSEISPDEFITREAVIQYDLGDNVSVSGRADYMTGDSIIEVKASVSSRKRAMWRRGEMLESHLGQLKSYMLFSQRDKGVLRAFYMHFTREGMNLSLEPFVHAVHELTVQDEQDLHAFYSTVKHAIVGGDLPPTPITTTPCVTCPFRDVCSLDLKSKDDFVDNVNTILLGEMQAKPVLNPTIKTHNRR